jgi:hypothetical protein
LREQDAHILDGRDQVILDLLSPEPPPTRTFEVVIVSGIGKTALHQMVPPFAIAPRGAAMRLRTRYIQGRLFFMSLHSASMVGARALGPENTSATHLWLGPLYSIVRRTGCMRGGLRT